MEEIKLITDYIDRAVKKDPKKIGFVDNTGETSYVEFSNAAKRIGSYIIKRGEWNRPIAIFLDKSTLCLETAMGIVYSGNYYTFLDTDMPIARISKIIDILQPAFIITDSRNKDELLQVASDVVEVEDILEEGIDTAGLKACRDKKIDTDIVYVLFTSGSTGQPKGVVISHINIITYMNWSKKAFGFDSDTVFGNQTPFYFSMSVLDIFQTINCGCKMVIIPKRLFTFPVELLNYIKEQNINTIYWVPSALCHVVNVGALDSVDVSTTLKKVLFAGEVMPTKQLNMWRNALPNIMYADLFGPTEVTDICTYYIVDREIKDTESVPIGYVCDNMNILIVDNNGNEVAKNEIGEMLVRGSSVSYGYFNNIEKTRESFIQNPVNKLYPEKVYKTGDLVYVNDRDEIIYVSRKDFQIKHMGYRIELGEIETAVSSIDGVLRNCCLYDNNNSQIVLFYTGDIQPSEIKKQLKKLLPKYMMPNVYNNMMDMPLNLNGKIDRALLKTKITE